MPAGDGSASDSQSHVPSVHMILKGHRHLPPVTWSFHMKKLHVHVPRCTSVSARPQATVDDVSSFPPRFCRIFLCGNLVLSGENPVSLVKNSVKNTVFLLEQTAPK